jgi:hypothetical protein
MIELITAFGIGAALGGVTLYLGYKQGYGKGHAAGYKLASDAANSARSVLGDILPLFLIGKVLSDKPAPSSTKPDEQNFS